MSGEDYRSTIAAMKQEAALRQQQADYREATAVYQEMQEAEQAATEALAAGDRDTADYFVQQLTEKEAQFNMVAERLPPQQPQIDPRLARFAQRNASFLQKYGQRAYEALDAAHQYMLRPRNPNTNDPRYTGMGFNPQHVFSPEYFRRLKDLMEVNGQLFDVRYDPSEQTLTANEAARISGLSPQAYNYAAKTMWAQGRLGGQKK
jgi:hypothetical protein